MHHHRKHPLAWLLGCNGLIVLAAHYLFGWPWDKVWRHYGAWLVIGFAAVFALRLTSRLWRAIYYHVPHGLLWAYIVGIVALWAVHRHLHRP